jgi:hypothetical protein
MKNQSQNTAILRCVRWVLLAASTAYLMGCATYANPYYNAAKPHHTPKGFKNNYIASATKGGAAFFRWQVERLRGGFPKPPEVPTPQVNADVQFIKTNAIKTGFSAKLASLGAVHPPHFLTRCSPLSLGWAMPPCWCRPVGSTS